MVMEKAKILTISSSGPQKSQVQRKYPLPRLTLEVRKIIPVLNLVLARGPIKPSASYGDHMALNLCVGMLGL